MIAAANISLKYLFLGEMQLPDLLEARRFVDAVLKFERLETLKILSFTIPFPHCIKICKNCRELSTLHAKANFEISKQQILEIIGHATKLQSLYLNTLNKDNTIVQVDINFFQDLLKIVKSRRGKTSLEIIFNKYMHPG